MSLARALGNRLRGSPAASTAATSRSARRSGPSCTRSVFVRCGPHRGDATIVDDPVLVVEVLSPSTEQHDLTRKRWAYQAIPSLQTVLFIDPDRPVVEILAREGGDAWRSRVVEGLEASLGIAALGIELPLAEIYRGHRDRAGAPGPATPEHRFALTRSPRGLTSYDGARPHDEHRPLTPAYRAASRSGIR